MNNISTGAGLAIVGRGIALHPVASHVLASTPRANAASPVSLVAAVATQEAGPTIVWMGVTETQYVNSQTRGGLKYHRLWSDGRVEYRHCCWTSTYCALVPEMSEWIEIPPPIGGNGFACRTDVNGDRVVDSADLSLVLNTWGQQGGCEPEATYPCFTLGSLTNAAALK